MDASGPPRAPPPLALLVLALAVALASAAAGFQIDLKAFDLPLPLPLPLSLNDEQFEEGDCIFQHDAAPVHNALPVGERLHDSNVPVMDWPALDSYSFGMVWDDDFVPRLTDLHRYISATQHEEWAAVPQEAFHQLTERTPAREEAAIKANVTAASAAQTRTGCYARLETPEGFLDSPNYPADYPPGLDCCYDIARPSTSYCGVKLYAEQLVVGKQPSDGAFCQTDWLAMESCVPEGGSRYCGNLTGSTYQFLFQPGSRALRFQFHSSSSSGGAQRPRPEAGAVLRFRLRYRLLRSCRGLFQEPAVGPLPGPGPRRPCYARVRHRRGAIHTPGYPSPYPPGQDCVYEFVRPNPFICGVRMRSTSFELEPSVSTPFGGACSDFLQTPGCGFLCGSLNFTWLAVYQPGATSQRFHFHSDEENNFNGFFITFEQVYHCPDS